MKHRTERILEWGTTDLWEGWGSILEDIKWMCTKGRGWRGVVKRLIFVVTLPITMPLCVVSWFVVIIISIVYSLCFLIGLTLFCIGKWLMLGD